MLPRACPARPGPAVPSPHSPSLVVPQNTVLRLQSRARRLPRRQLKGQGLCCYTNNSHKVTYVNASCNSLVSQLCLLDMQGLADLESLL